MSCIHNKIKKIKDPESGEERIEKVKTSLWVRIIIYLIILVFSPVLLFLVLYILFLHFFMPDGFNIDKFNTGLINLMVKKKKDINISDEDKEKYKGYNVYKETDNLNG